MSLTAVSWSGLSTPLLAPPRPAARAWSGPGAPLPGLVRLIEPVRGSAPFMAQWLAQETPDSGLYLPRWRERHAAYAPPAPARTLDLVA
jgi:hypothetical protein